ncbi:MAG: hypothetical protein AVDCRST_MAG40-2489, partial [uncultured Gemmatimonadaceae bacterium]
CSRRRAAPCGAGPRRSSAARRWTSPPLPGPSGGCALVEGRRRERGL